jgi:photosystem II stability/assembly factor-like uncharacterized protein
MKINLATIAIATLLIAAAECKAQWTPVYQDIDAQFYDAAFPTNHTGYVAASDTGGAVVLRTTDGGATWNKRYIPGLGFIHKIAMTDSLKGYIIAGGTPVKLIRTNNGFNTFTGHTLDSSFIVQALYLLNDSTGFYLNNGSRLRKFENYGATYFHVIDTLTAGQNLQFVNSTSGYLDTGYGLLKTTDSGVSWNFVNTNLGFYCLAFRFADSLNGYFSDLNNISVTHDGGVTFSQLYNFPNCYSFATNGSFCMAANNTGNVAYTSNGGLTWQIEMTGINWVTNEPYTVAMTPGGDCFLFSQFSGEIRKREVVTSIKANTEIDNTMSIYPNPFTSECTIYFGEEQKNVTVKIFDLPGKEIRTIYFTGNQLTLEKGELQPGVYCVQVIDEMKKVVNKKIILQ